ncbi:unnamed protein product [Nezara viridula]|uniref:Uncharacterized protein n=1 Tax=Nezara viridula TaxID=85310 RepID=A0A9P0HLE3_NEZVI|nr:unnamed protein product [Nezara viridula]
MIALELCWWEQTRLLLEEIFRKPRLTGTFPFTTGYDIRLRPALLVAIASIALNIGGIIYATEVRMNVFSIDIQLVRILKASITTTCNIFSPLWMIKNHKSIIKLLRMISSVEKELDKVTLKWNRKRHRLPFSLVPAIATTITIIQCLWYYQNNEFLTAFSLISVIICAYPAMSYVWQYLTLHDVLRSLMVRIGQLDDADSFVNCYHSLVKRSLQFERKGVHHRIKMSSIRKKTTAIIALELCWWEQTRLLLEDIFRKPRLTGTFPFTTGYDIRLWPALLVAVVSIAFNIAGITYAKQVRMNLYIFNIQLIRTVKATITTSYNIFSPLWMIKNHESIIKLLRMISSVEKELDKVSLKWKFKRHRLPFSLVPAIATIISIIQCLWLYQNNEFFTAFSLISVIICAYPAMSYVWQYLTLHDVLRSLMIRIGQLDDADSFVYCYHSLVVAYRAIDKLYGLQMMIYSIMAFQAILHSLHFVFSNGDFFVMTVCQILWASFYSVIVLLIIRKCNSSLAQVSENL